MTDRDQSDTLAVIKDAHFGVGDRGFVVLTFAAYVTESSAALQVFGLEDGADVMKAYGAADAAELNGQPCWVDTSKPGKISWSRPWKR